MSFDFPAMILQRSSKIQRKEFKVEGDDHIGDSGVISYLLENVANDDILFEIFVRIPDCRSAILCSSVSHRWHSLISQPRFLPRFISHHQQHRYRYPQPCTIIFRKCEKTFPCESTSALDFQPMCIMFSEESKFLHGKSTPPKCYLDFLPSPMVIRASCDDLLLLTPKRFFSTVFYVCNPVTKQFSRLPDCSMKIYTRVNPHDLCGYALARMPESECHFKVVLFHWPIHLFGGPSTSQHLKIYCSKLGKWKKIRFIYPQPGGFIWGPWVDVVMWNGILHWLEFKRSSQRVLSFDFHQGCSVIDFPDDFWWFRSPDFRGHVREQIGNVGGELRLLQVVLTKRNKFVYLKVWRLLDSSSSLWVLVHDKKHSKRPNEERLCATFVHPTNGDMVFMVWGKSVFRYNLMMEEADAYEMINELQEPFKLSKDHLMFFPMVHPPWPTPLPST